MTHEDLERWAVSAAQEMRELREEAESFFLGEDREGHYEVFLRETVSRFFGGMGMSIAEKIAAQMGNDGVVFEAPNGRTLADLCESAGAEVEVDERDVDVWRYEFADGSALTGSAGGWDIEGSAYFVMEGSV